MAKQGGLGDNLYVGGFNLSGDTGALSRIGGGPKPLELTGIDRSAHERQGGQRDGEIAWQAWFNDAVGAAHPALKVLPTTDRLVTYHRGTAIGGQAAALLAKQVNYDPQRGADGSLTIAVQALGSGFGLEWAQQLTAGVRTDTGATNGASIDTLAAASFGAQGYLQVFAFAGTDVTVKIQDSADASAWADVAGLTFATITAAPTAERLATSNTATIRRHLRAVTTTSGGFSSLSFAVLVNKNEIAGQVF